MQGPRPAPSRRLTTNSRPTGCPPWIGANAGTSGRNPACNGISHTGFRRRARTAVSIFSPHLTALDSKSRESLLRSSTPRNANERRRTARVAFVFAAPGRALTRAAPGQECQAARHRGTRHIDVATFALRGPHSSRSTGSTIRDLRGRTDPRCGLWQFRLELSLVGSDRDGKPRAARLGRSVRVRRSTGGSAAAIRSSCRRCGAAAPRSRANLVSRFRVSHHCAAHSFANFGIKRDTSKMPF